MGEMLQCLEQRICVAETLGVASTVEAGKITGEKIREKMNK